MSNGRFERVDPASSLTNGFIPALLEDPDGNLWIGTDRGFFLRKPSGSIRRLDRTASLPEAAVLSLRLAADGRIIAASNQGALRADLKGAEILLHPKLPTSASRAILSSLDGSTWISRRGEVWRLPQGSSPEMFSLGKTSPIATSAAVNSTF